MKPKTIKALYASKADALMEEYKSLQVRMCTQDSDLNDLVKLKVLYSNIKQIEEFLIYLGDL